MRGGGRAADRRAEHTIDGTAAATPAELAVVRSNCSSLEPPVSSSTFRNSTDGVSAAAAVRLAVWARASHLCRRADDDSKLSLLDVRADRDDEDPPSNGCRASCSAASAAPPTSTAASPPSAAAAQAAGGTLHLPPPWLQESERCVQDVLPFTSPPNPAQLMRAAVVAVQPPRALPPGEV